MKQNETNNLDEKFIVKEIGESYLSPNEISYKEKSKFVQQGHEAVTPTQLDRRPESVKNNLNNDQYKLYELIWKRTIASQMAQSKSLETTYLIEGGNFVIRSSGSIQVFDGFKKDLQLFRKK